jgi:hypothetical protein
MKTIGALALALLALASPALAQSSGSSQATREMQLALTDAGRFGAPRFTTALLPACAASNKGALVFDTTTSTFKVCNGTAFVETSSTVTGGTITCGTASQACTFDVPATVGPTLTFENALALGGADITKPAYLFDVAANLGASDYHTNWRDNGTTSLMSLSGAGVLLTASSITSGGQITAGAANAIGFSGRSFWTSGANGTLTATNAAATDFDTLNLGPATPADIGAVTVSCQNTGTAGCILLANTAASGAADTGWILRAVGDLAAADTVLSVQDNNGSGSLLTVDGVGLAQVATAGGFSILSRGRIVSGGGDGVLSATNTAGTGTASINQGRNIEAVTTTKSPAVTESWEIYTNSGDADGATVTLPAAASFVCYTFVVEAAQTFTITADASDTIRVGASVTAAGGSIDSATIGDSVTLCGITAGTWVSVGGTGTGF